MQDPEEVLRYAELLQVQEVGEAKTKDDMHPVHTLGLEQVEQ
jgi:hypothetical protein